MTQSGCQLELADKRGPGRELAGEGAVAEAVPSGGKASLRRTAIDGAFWTILCALLNKVVTFGGQIVLARLLVPEDFGLVALAGSITGIAGLLSAGSLQNVLIQQGERFKELAGHVFWLGLTLHGAAGLVVALLAPAAGLLFHEPRVVPLVLVGALSIPLASLNYVYSAKLYIDLRFRTMTAIQVGEGALQTGLAVVLAGVGWGPYAILLPQVVVRLYAAAACRLAAGRVAVGRPAPRQWLPLVRPGLWLMLSIFLSGFQMNAVFLVIGAFLDAASTGLFSWGHQIASQAIFLLIINLRQVLVPMLVKLKAQPERQQAGFYSGVKVMTAVSVAVCSVQALVAPVLVPLIFGPRWAPAVPVIVWLSMGLATAPLTLMTSSLFVGRAMNAAAAGLAGVQTLLVLVGATAGALLGDYQWVARLVAAGLLAGNVTAFLAARSHFRRSAARPSVAEVPLVPVSC